MPRPARRLHETILGRVTARRQSRRTADQPQPFIFEVGVTDFGQVILRAIDVSGKTCATIVLEGETAPELAELLKQASARSATGGAG